MHYSTAVAALVLASTTLAAPAPAPEPIGAGAGALIGGLISGIGAAAGGGLVGGLGLLNRGQKKRQVSQDQNLSGACTSALAGARVTISEPRDHDIDVEGLPPACMDLVRSFSGDTSNSRPEITGPDSVEFQGLTDDEYNWIAGALEAIPEADD